MSARSSAEFFKLIEEKKISNNIIVMGESFYIQLFLNSNLAKKDIYYVYTISKQEFEKLWFKDGKIKHLSNISYSEDNLYIWCGLSVQVKKEFEKKYNNINYYDIFARDDIKQCGGFEFSNQFYIVDDVKWVASNPFYMYKAYDSIKNECLYSYLQELVKEPASRSITRDGIICLNEYRSKYINHVNGRRINLYIPTVVNSKIHVFGDSRVSGYMLEDRDLFTNILQYRLNEKNLQIEVVNYGIPGREIERMRKQVETAAVSKGDLVIVLTACHEYRQFSYELQDSFALHVGAINRFCMSKGVGFLYVNLPTTVEMNPADEFENTITDLYRNYKFNEYSIDIIQRYKKYLFMRLGGQSVWYHDLAVDFNSPHSRELFINMHHYSPAGNEVIADFLMKIVENYMRKTDQEKVNYFYDNSLKQIKCYCKNGVKPYSLLRRTAIEIGGLKGFITSSEFRFKAYLWLNNIIKERKADLVRKKANAKIGSIVMNANPFTLGHKYLVEYAANMVDYLYIFVLKEDKSEISYDDRLKMVVSGIKDIKNVSVVSGGNNVISDETFPEYFMKKELQNANIDAYKDIERFGTKVAPLYGINCRFFGEEPIDNVTRQYNEQMKQFLPQFGIEAVEIQRKKDIKGCISASRVREYLDNGNWDEIEKIVPRTTLLQLKKSPKSSKEK